MGVVVGSFTGADREQALRGYAERFALKIELARDKALQTNREWGVYIDDEGVRFAEFDEINAEWLERPERPFHTEELTASLDISVEAEKFTGAQNNRGINSNEKKPPQLVLFSSGETTPFKIEIEPRDWETLPWLLESDGFTRTEISRDET